MPMQRGRRKLEWIRSTYPAGTKVILGEMQGEPQMKPGLKGEVVAVDDIGQIHMKWENGSTLALNIEVDRFQKIETPKKVKDEPLR